MCLIVKKSDNPEIEILKEDKIVYKLLNPGNYALFRNTFRYEKGKLNNVGEINLVECEICTAIADAEASDYYNWLNRFDKETGLSEYLSVGRGFHFFTTKKRTDGLMFILDHSLLTEFKVPKGSQVCFDKTGLGVSNQIIML